MFSAGQVYGVNWPVFFLSQNKQINSPRKSETPGRGKVQTIAVIKITVGRGWGRGDQTAERHGGGFCWNNVGQGGAGKVGRLTPSPDSGRVVYLGSVFGSPGLTVVPYSPVLSAPAVVPKAMLWSGSLLRKYTQKGM